MTYLEVAPLHRLLERRETAVLLEEFAALMPGTELALVGADGRPFVGTVEWLPEELAKGLEQARAGRTVREGDRLFVPLMAGEQVVGVLAVCGPDLTYPPVDHALHCLRRSIEIIADSIVDPERLISGVSVLSCIVTVIVVLRIVFVGNYADVQVCGCG